MLRIFSEATKIVKVWAKHKAIYHFNFGYFNGISIMIMVAKVMHLMVVEGSLKLDAYAPVVIQNVVERFFFMYGNWPWTSTDVRLRAIYLPITKTDDYPWTAFSNCELPVICPYPPYKCTTV